MKGRRARTARKGDRNEGRELSVGVVRPRFPTRLQILGNDKTAGIRLNPIIAIERTRYFPSEIVPFDFRELFGIPRNPSIRIADYELGCALIAPC